MAGDDAKLRISVDDQMSGALKRMEASVRQFGTIVNAEAKDVNKAITSINKTMGTLGASGTGGIAGATTGLKGYRQALRDAKSDLKGFQDQMAALQHVAGAKTLPNGAGRGVNGQFISKADMAAYKTAATGLAAASAEISRLKWFPPDMLKSTAAFTAAITGASNATRYVMYDIARNMAIGGAAVAAFGTASVIAAASFEKSFAAVNRTVHGTTEELSGVQTDLIELSQTLPVAFKDLTEIAALGGQMGIGASGIAAYTETVAKLTATTNLTAEAAGTALGRFKAFFAEAEDSSLAVTDQTFSNLASSILKVGVNSVATETGIVGVATQISSMGDYAGFTADQVVGLAGALSSVGVPPELSRGVVTRLFNTMSEAVASGGTRLEDFAGIAGTSASDFQAAWGTERFAHVFTDFIAGLENMQESGGNAVASLHELGITSVRDVPVLLRLANAANNAGQAGGLLAQTMNDARTGWRDNIELTLQYTKISQTLAARFQVLTQNFAAMFASFGTSSLAPLKGVLDFVIGIVQGFTDMANTGVGQVVSGIVVGFSLLAGGILIVSAGMIGMGAASLGAAKGLAAMGVGAEFATGAVTLLSRAIAVTSVIGLLLAVAAAVIGFTNASKEALNPVKDMGGALAAMEADTKAGSGFDLLQGSMLDTAGAAKETTSQADNLGKALGLTSENAYGVGDGMEDAGEKSRFAALKFGEASRAFLKSSITQSQSFQDLFKGDAGGKFADALAKGGFELDKFNDILARKGRDAAQKYLEGITSVKATKGLPNAYAGIIDMFGATNVSDLEGRLLDIGELGVKSFTEAGKAAQAAGDGMIVFTDATQIAGAEMQDFAVQNEDAINAIAGGFKQFVDTASLIGFTQQFQEASRTQDDLATEVDEHAAALGDYKAAWQDAYGGAKFSLKEYMVQFSAAGEEQKSFTRDIQTLFARGLDPAIIGDLAAMGPQATKLVQALVASTDTELQAYEDLYAQTGFDSMVGLAAGQLAAQQIVMNAAKKLSTAQLQQLSADLAAGTPLVDAMKKWQLDAMGNPIEVPTQAEMDWYKEQRRLQNLVGGGIQVPVTPYLTKSHFTVTGSNANGSFNGNLNARVFASGGYTGDGGKYQPKGVVHGGEFVFTKEATRALGVGNLYNMMNNAQKGTPAAKSGGYASGGAVSGTQTSVVHLSVEDRQLLVDIRERVGITITEKAVTGAANAGNANYATRRSA
jgi:TP901 family phage tail tape measure protein